MGGADNTSFTVRNLVQATQQQTVSPNDSVIVWKSNGFAIYTLPSAASQPGRVVNFIKDPGGSGSIQIFPASGDTADGTTQSWNCGGGNPAFITIVSDGVTGWWTITSANVTRI
jgi:hypothetical protein